MLLSALETSRWHRLWNHFICFRAGVSVRAPPHPPPPHPPCNLDGQYAMKDVDSSNPGEVNWETGAGGWENGYIGDGQAANRKCTAHTHHRTRVRAQVLVGLPWNRCFCYSGMLA